MTSLIVAYDSPVADGSLKRAASCRTFDRLDLEDVARVIKCRGFKPDLDVPDGTVMVHLGEMHQEEAEASRRELYGSLGSIA